MARSREHGAEGAVSGWRRALAPVVWPGCLEAARGLGSSSIAGGPGVPPDRRAGPARRGASAP
ncbi:hypothetical protein AB3662_44990 [Sorangium cellulosum]|uniref:hypothetical protein n=1 Tax=Sorangium cellulosum TaxID=56 RepID=UPI003D9A7F44